MSSRVFVTAYGASTPLGATGDEITTALRDGCSGIRAIEKYDTASFRSKYAGVPEEGNAAIRWPSDARRCGDLFYTDLAMQRLIASMSDAGSVDDMERVGVFLGVDEPVLDICQTLDFATSLRPDPVGPGYENLDEAIETHFRLTDFLTFDPSNALRRIHRVLPFRGPGMIHTGLCSASLQSLGAAFQSIRSGRIDRAIVGGVSAKVTPEHYIGLEAVDVIATDDRLQPDCLSRPFDSRRSGYVPAEGAILFLLESAEAARARQADPLMEVSGYGSALNANHVVKPHPTSEEMVAAMCRALKDADIAPEHIGLVNAHGTSTQLNDKHEADAINRVLPHRVPVTANKSLHGHLIAAAGAMETLNTLLSFQAGIIPGTRNLDDRDAACDVDAVPETRDAQVDHCLKNSFGMGGLAASVVLSRCA
ncbi:3-oxoacyl-[acyl-carrier-protein] synthase 2 [Roseobacter cerasinus]|uniref:3-oxoacyl-[acyl-carrier-protein] synthase 2 n=1 Tax=Roseobacter cerasinus TaxID=2602289 RepID=A0A640VUA7_9RHOB|nr:beta-ketoacyl-[acyl-carrier-protein] synthase family protein [Roseobacter cerasinus]GFE51609.1 3-oxoacyl-[acyl-carrier-protein] synthase 2 [Roseobacter cerasinus]